MLAIDFGLLVLIGLYLDNTMPRKIGKRRSIFFCILPSYWCGTKRSSKVATRDKKTSETRQDLIKEIREFET